MVYSKGYSTRMPHPQRLHITGKMENVSNLMHVAKSLQINLRSAELGQNNSKMNIYAIKILLIEQKCGGKIRYICHLQSFPDMTMM